MYSIYFWQSTDADHSAIAKSEGRGAPKFSRRNGFSLVELLAVLAIITLLTTLLVPATASLLGTAGRKGAVNTLLGAFDQARVAAIEAASPVTVYFWKRPTPERDAYIIVRHNRPNNQPEFLTGWKPLPKGIIFYDPKRTHSSSFNGTSTSVLSLLIWARYDSTASFNGTSTSVLSLLSINLNNTSALPTDVAQDAANLPQVPPLGQVAALKFNEFGAIEHPTDNPLALFLGEGFRDDDGRETLTGPREKANSGGIEKLAFSRFTGRATLEISVGD